MPHVLNNLINPELCDIIPKSSNSQKKLALTSISNQTLVILSQKVQLTVHSQLLQHMHCLVTIATSTTSDVDQFTFNIVKRRTMQKVCSDSHVTEHAACLSQ